MKLTNCIYRFIDINGETIYIGKAKDLKKRLSNHTHLPEECYKERVKTEFAIFETEHTMDLAERYYIPKYKPKYNQILSDNLVAVDIEAFDNVKWYVYNPYLIFAEEKEIKKILEINKYKCRLHELELKEFELTTLNKEEDLVELEYLRRDITRTKKQLRLAQLHHPDYEDLLPWERELFFKYDGDTKEEVLSNILRKIEDDIVSLCEEQLQRDGYYVYTVMLERVYEAFKYNQYFKDKEWLYWIDETMNPGILTSSYTHKIKMEAEQMIKRIEASLNWKYGDLERKVIEKLEPLYYDNTILIPKAVLVDAIIE